MNNYTITAENLNQSVYNIRLDVMNIMEQVGMYIDPNATTPDVKLISWEEALQEARDENDPRSEQELKKLYDSICGFYNPKDNSIYLKTDTAPTASLLAHELCHSFQDKQTLIDATQDNDDLRRLDSVFEAEAYSVQAIFETGELSRLLEKARSTGMTPYAFLMDSWNKRGRYELENIIRKQDFNSSYERAKHEIEQMNKRMDEMRNRKNRYDELSKEMKERQEQFNKQFAETDAMIDAVFAERW